MRLLRAWDSFWGYVGFLHRNRRQRKAQTARRRNMRRRQRMDLLEQRVVLNADPVAQDDYETLTVPYGTGWQTVDISGIQPNFGNDSDPDNDSILLHNSGNPGTAWTAPGQTVQFGYTITDGNGGYGSATVYVNIVEDAPQNNAPYANNVTFNHVIPYGSSNYYLDLSGDVPQMPGDYGDQEGTPTISYSNFGGTYVNAGQQYSYGYTVTDAGGLSASANVYINITEDAPPPTNQPPTANNDDLGNVVQGHTVTGNILANDTDPEGQPLSTSYFSGAVAGGTLTVETNGSFTFLADGSTGSGSYSYTAYDDAGQPSSATLSWNVVPNTAPTANNESIGDIIFGASASGNLLANDTDPDSDSLTTDSFRGSFKTVVGRS